MKFPRILGIEAVGIVEEAPGGEFNQGDTVATVTGGMGRDLTEATPSTRVYRHPSFRW